ncbi:hypothetical protein [Paraburkholderia solisilvae]|uniref:hypothetical protein n=1 Tax=Paraburkholderia solisilvae TaxID=624376 RepID=UPI001583C825|nr:hypothetical protein [Paraburkholderia solisilvae]
MRQRAMRHSTMGADADRWHTNCSWVFVDSMRSESANLIYIVRDKGVSCGTGSKARNRFVRFRAFCVCGFLFHVNVKIVASPAASLASGSGTCLVGDGVLTRGVRFRIAAAGFAADRFDRNKSIQGAIQQ